MSSTRRTPLLLILTLVAAIQAWSPGPAGAVRLTAVDGGPNYYARFSRALPTATSYFPIGVWFESVLSQNDINLDKDAGLNLYVNVTANSDLSVVQSNGMRALLQSEWNNSVGHASPANSGWVVADEADMIYGPGAGYTQLQQYLDALPAGGRLRYANYGKGVTFWESDSQAAQFVNSYQDVVSDDNYWFTDNNICGSSEGGVLLNGGSALSSAQCHRAANYGATVQRVRSLVSPAGSKPVWAIVELGHPFSEADWPTIKPAEVRAAVWQSLIAGARGIVYFNHSFGGPHETQHILRDGSNPSSAYAPIRSVATATNREIEALAPVLNSPTVSSGWSQGAGTTAMVKWETAKTTAEAKCRSKKNKRSARRRRPGSPRPRRGASPRRGSAGRRAGHAASTCSPARREGR